jgi:hypothetical protein
MFEVSALFRGTKVVKHSFYSIGTKTMIGSGLEHFSNLRHLKRCKTCVSGLNALFRGAKVVKHLFYCVGPKMMFVMFWSISILCHVNDAKLLSEPEAISLYQSCEAFILPRSTQNGVWECFKAFR